MTKTNAFAKREFTGTYTETRDFSSHLPGNPDYAVPDIDTPIPYDPYESWATPLNKGDLAGTPDGHRIGTHQIHDPHPVNDEAFHRARDAETANRYLVEKQTAPGWNKVTSVKKEIAEDPRRVPGPENRPTMHLSPDTWRFERPFDQHKARELNGVHISMADHRRDYEIYGMAPVSRRRNTIYQIPAGWDVNSYEHIPTYDPPEQIAAYVDVPARERRL